MVGRPPWSARVPLDPLLAARRGALMTEIVRLALEEDIGTGDVTSIACVPETRRAAGSFLAREPLTLAGVDLLWEIYQLRGGVDELNIDRKSTRLNSSH